MHDYHRSNVPSCAVYRVILVQHAQSNQMMTADSPKQRADLPMIMMVAVVMRKQYMFYSLLTHVHARE